jgi:sodium/bile acid cotransporter 7
VAIVIMASQKSAPVAVTVISYITSDPAAQGLLAIPCIVGQLVQIFLGAAMAPPIARRVEQCNAVQAAANTAHVSELESADNGGQERSAKGAPPGIFNADEGARHLHKHVTGVQLQHQSSAGIASAGTVTTAHALCTQMSRTDAGEEQTAAEVIHAPSEIEVSPP